MEQDYRIEALVATFEDHAKMSDQHQDFVNKVFLEQNPGQELPTHMANPFNIAYAFATMCSEINKLKEELAYHKNHGHPWQRKE